MHTPSPSRVPAQSPAHRAPPSYSRLTRLESPPRHPPRPPPPRRQADRQVRAVAVLLLQAGGMRVLHSDRLHRSLRVRASLRRPLLQLLPTGALSRGSGRSLAPPTPPPAPHPLSCSHSFWCGRTPGSFAGPSTTFSAVSAPQASPSPAPAPPPLPPPAASAPHTPPRAYTRAYPLSPPAPPTPESTLSSAVSAAPQGRERRTSRRRGPGDDADPDRRVVLPRAEAEPAAGRYNACSEMPAHCRPEDTWGEVGRAPPRRDSDGAVCR